MEDYEKSARTHDFQDGAGHGFSNDGAHDMLRSSAADRRDMYRLGKVQEMKVSVTSLMF